MRVDVSHCPDLTLPRGAVTRFEQAQGTRLSCVEGSLWITRDGDPIDVILEPGQSWEVPGPQRVIAQAMARSTLRVQSGPHCQPAVAEQPAPRPAPRATSRPAWFAAALAWGAAAN